MVNYSSTTNLDLVFSSLADPTRRDILSRLTRGELTVSEIAGSYDMSLPAISKHLNVLRRAQLIRKRKQGQQQLVSIAPGRLVQAEEYLTFYKHYWLGQLESLENFLIQEER